MILRSSSHGSSEVLSKLKAKIGSQVSKSSKSSKSSKPSKHSQSSASDTFLTMSEMLSNGFPVDEKCLRDIHIRKQIGTGTFGAVYDVSDSFVLKIYAGTDKKNLEREQTLSVLVSKHKIGPWISDAWFCPAKDLTHESKPVEVALILMDKYDNTLLNWSLTYIPTLPMSKVKKALSLIKWQLRKKLNALHRLRVVHNDLHLRNVLLKYHKDHPERITNLAIIDYGLAERLDAGITSQDIQVYFQDDNHSLKEMINWLNTKVGLRENPTTTTNREVITIT